MPCLASGRWRRWAHVYSTCCPSMTHLSAACIPWGRPLRLGSQMSAGPATRRTGWSLSSTRPGSSGPMAAPMGPTPSCPSPASPCGWVPRLAAKRNGSPLGVSSSASRRPRGRSTMRVHSCPRPVGSRALPCLSRRYQAGRSGALGMKVHGSMWAATGACMRSTLRLASMIRLAVVMSLRTLASMQPFPRIRSSPTSPSPLREMCGGRA
mmetsp:Transcript_13039/g.23462  ORF Transcript_13039/g.23462 Transcript_13039/m.23462 type:complete len:209 (-) Transcript_13039:4317-4943(-)